jgi:two-component system cell cycle sensor histidine kinase/response regulator CckA
MPTQLVLEGPSTGDAAEAWRGAPAGDPAHSSAPIGRRVLVADDDPDVRRLIGRLLAEECYEVVLARHGGEALEHAREGRPFNLLITDIRMPGIGGWELSRRLREQWPGLPVLYISGFDVELTLGAALGTANGAFLRKPFDLDELSRQVARLLGGA